MASGLYNRGAAILVDGTVTWGTTTCGIVLVTSSYTPDNAHNFVSDLTNELSGGNYARGTVAGESGPTEADANDRVEYDMNDQVFSALQAAAGTPQYAILYDNTAGTDGTRELIAWFDLGTPAVPNGTDYTIQWAAPAFYLSTV